MEKTIKKVNVEFYRMYNNDETRDLFSKEALNRCYQIIDNGVYYTKFIAKNSSDISATKVRVPYNITKEHFQKVCISLFPIGKNICTKNCYGKGKIISYILEENAYLVTNEIGNWYKVNFDNAVLANIYYFVSSLGKVQCDLVGRDEMVEKFRRKTNNFFETKEEAQKKLYEMLV